MGFFQFILPTRRQTGSGLLVSGIVLAFIVASSQTEALPTMNLGSLWFHHNNVEPWNHKDFPYNNNRNRWYTTTPKVYELEGISDDGEYEGQFYKRIVSFISWVYASVSQPVCPGTLVCREIIPSVPQNFFWTSLLLFFCGKWGEFGCN